MPGRNRNRNRLGAAAAPRPVITTTALPDADEDQAYSQTLAATGTVTTWSIVSGALPAGLSLDSGTGEISGTPTESGAFDFDVRAANAGGHDDQSLTLTVNASELVFGDTFTGSDEDPFVDDNWTVEPYTGGNVQLLGNRLRTSNSTGGDGLNMFWYDGQQIPSNWQTITVDVAVEFAAGVFCNAAIALCMDNPPTGNATHGSGSSLQNGYAVECRRGGFEEVTTRFHGGARTNLHFVDDSSLDAGIRLFRVVFTKMADRVRMQIYYDGSLLATVDDTDANRKTGACYVGLGSYAPSTNYVYFDGFEVTVTF